MYYTQVVADLKAVALAVDYYSQEFEQAQPETRISGSLEKAAQDLSGHITYRFTQLQDLESILKYLNIRYDKMRSDLYRKYLEKYNRDLSDRSIEKYLDGETTLVDMNTLICEVALIRNKYLGLMKGFEAKSWQINNIVKLRSIGIEDTRL